MNIETKNKIHEINLYVNQNPSIFVSNNLSISSETNKKSILSIDASISKKAISKSNIINSKQRSIQDCMSIIQAQEGRVEKIQKNLEQVRYSYLEGLKNQKKESNRTKIQIKFLPKDEKKLSYNNGIDKLQLDTFDEDSKVIDVLEGLLNNIKKIKTELNERKSRLLSLEGEVKLQESKLEQLKMRINDQYISEYLDAIYIQNDINNEVLINIHI